MKFLFYLVQGVSALKLVTYNKGIPYLSGATVKMKNNNLVFNDDHAQAFDVVLNNGVLQAKSGNHVDSIVVDEKTQQMKVRLSGNDKDNAIKKKSQMWAKSDNGVIKLGNSAVAYGCPYDKSGVYVLYWGKKPDNCYGGQKVGLQISE